MVGKKVKNMTVAYSAWLRLTSSVLLALTTVRAVVRRSLLWMAHDEICDTNSFPPELNVHVSGVVSTAIGCLCRRVRLQNENARRRCLLVLLMLNIAARAPVWKTKPAIVIVTIMIMIYL